jgi:molybdopterin synthase catalytic subunit
MGHKKGKNIFIDGVIPASFISDSIVKHATKNTIGGDSIF